MDLMTVVSIACAVVTAASAICAATPTPDPSSALGKVYRVVEMLGLVVGKAKQSGLVPANAAADQLGADVVAVAKGVIGKVAVAGLVAGCLGLSACSGMPAVAPVAADADAAKLQPQIVKACLGSGLFKLADGALALAVPAATLPVDLVNAGIDRVCADPATAAKDAGAVEAALKVLAAHVSVH